ncbi:restriction endonuclease, partial [mine drainage metagenome]
MENPWALIEYVVDFLNPELDAFEASLYLYLLRNTIIKTGSPTIRVGKRSIALNWVKGSRGGGTGNAGGVYVNYGHVTATLKGLEAKGCLSIGDTNRDGTLYTLRLPVDIPLVAAKIA